jgi:hypothetical protein
VATDRLFLVDAAQFAFGYKPALATHRAQDSALGNLLSKALQQLVLRLIRSQIYRCQVFHLLSPLDTVQPTIKKSPAEDRGSTEQIPSYVIKR